MYRMIALSTILASSLVPVAGARAADLPVVVEPVDYVRICDAAGVGHFFIPGTETCMNIQTRVRTDYNLYFNFDDNYDDRNFYSGDTNDRLYRFRARGYVRTSTITQTEFGQLTTFVDIFVTKDTAPRGGGGANAAEVELDSALIQLGGLILGRFATTFGSDEGVYVIEQTFDLGNNTEQVNQIAYQFDFKNGILLQVALEDTTERRNNIANGIYGGAQIPDIVAKLSIQQGWGSAFLSGAGHYMNTISSPTVFPGGRRLRGGISDEDYGFAVAGGAQVNLPFGNATRLGVQAGYALGAQDFVNDGMSSTSGTPDAVYSANGDLKLGEFISVVGGVGTSLTPTVSAALGAGWTHASYDTAFQPDVSNINVQGNIGWTPVSGLLFALGAEYRYIDQSNGAPDGSLLTTFFRAQAEF